MRSLILLTLVLIVAAVPLVNRDLVALLGADTPQDLSSVTAITRTTHTYRSTTTSPTLTATTPEPSTASAATIVAGTMAPMTTSSTIAPSTVAATSEAPIYMSSSMAPTFSSVPEAPTTSAEEATQWKVIGIGIITVGLIATVILSIIFFDSWWKFFCDLFCGRWRRRGEETLVPDWTTRDWEFKLANEEGHRYPTLSSLVDMTEARRPRPNAT